ncbi:MAG: hypothetical protein GMKNLPBB_01830 [Myxococcota bacterium]|nr:hypothetical protein [Myxococcota bacterium]
MTRMVLYLFAAAVCWPLPLQAGPKSSRNTPPGDGLLAAVLNKAVDPRSGLVDYAAIKTMSPQLDAWLNLAAQAKPDAWKRNEQLAFWINAYNALVLRGAAQRHPLRTVMDVPGFFDKTKHRVAGHDLTLNELENQRIRAVFGDPRIHFALNCAARSCPRLRAAPWKAQTLDADLDAAAREFLASPGGMALDQEKRVVRLSKIFEWYRQDFELGGARLLDFVRLRLTASDARLLGEGVWTISFLDYDWTLNAK